MDSGFLKSNGDKVALLRRGIDAFVILSLLWAVSESYDQTWNSKYQVLALVAIVVFFGVTESINLYRCWRGKNLWVEASKILFCWFPVVFSVLLVAFWRKETSDISRLILTVWFVVTPLTIVVFHCLLTIVARFFRSRGRNTRRIAIAGCGPQALQVLNTIRHNPWLGYTFEGFFDDYLTSCAGDEFSVDFKGDFEKLAALCLQQRVDVVYICLPFAAQKKIQSFLDSVANTTASVFVVPDIFLFELSHARWTTFGETPAIALYDTPFYGVDGVVKRVEDLLLSTLLVPVVIPLMGVIACLVKLSSPGPIFFKQKRYGLDGKEITVWKFRTMFVHNDPTVVQAKKGDSRITLIGSFLRRSSLDELPQFVNVIQGRMSIVGPRPHAVEHNEEYRNKVYGYMMRHKVRPGITGWAQVNGWRGEVDTLLKMEKRVECDLFYIRNWSVHLDIKIMILTLFKGFVHKNAY